MTVEARIEFWVPTEWADHNVDYTLYADLVTEATQAGLFHDLREFPAFYHWKSGHGEASGHVSVGRMADGTPVVNYSYDVSGQFFSGFFRDMADKLGQMQKTIGFANVDDLLIMNNLFMDSDAEFLSVSGWVKTTEAVYQAAEAIQANLLARLGQDGSAGAVEHLTDQASTPKAV